MDNQLKQVIINNQKTNYYISSDGKLYNSKTETWYKGRICENGYLDYILTIDKKQKSFRAHRLVAEAFIPNPKNLPIVNHIDGNKLNNNVSNLEWVTNSENVIHAYKNNLRSKQYTYIKFDKSLPNEEWRDIFNTDKYKISNLGRVWNTKTNRILAGKQSSGYIRYELTYNSKHRTFLGHRLVYYAFNQDKFDIFDTSRIINHIDGDKKNNKLDNLEEVTKSENMLHSYYITKTNKRTKPVIQYDSDMNIIKEFPSANQAARETGILQNLITSACQREGKSHGFNWRYKES